MVNVARTLTVLFLLLGPLFHLQGCGGGEEKKDDKKDDKKKDKKGKDKDKDKDKEAAEEGAEEEGAKSFVEKGEIKEHVHAAHKVHKEVTHAFSVPSQGHAKQEHAKQPEVQE